MQLMNIKSVYKGSIGKVSAAQQGWDNAVAQTSTLTKWNESIIKGGSRQYQWVAQRKAIFFPIVECEVRAEDAQLNLYKLLWLY